MIERQRLERRSPQAERQPRGSSPTRCRESAPSSSRSASFETISCTLRRGCRDTCRRSDIRRNREEDLRLDLAEPVQHALRRQSPASTTTRPRPLRPPRARPRSSQARWPHNAATRSPFTTPAAAALARIATTSSYNSRLVIVRPLLGCRVGLGECDHCRRVVAAPQQVLSEVDSRFGKELRARHAIAVDDDRAALVADHSAVIPHGGPEGPAIGDRPLVQRFVIREIAGSRESSATRIRPSGLSRPHGRDSASRAGGITGVGLRAFARSKISRTAGVSVNALDDVGSLAAIATSAVSNEVRVRVENALPRRGSSRPCMSAEPWSTATQRG